MVCIASLQVACDEIQAQQVTTCGALSRLSTMWRIYVMALPCINGFEDTGRASNDWLQKTPLTWLDDATVGTKSNLPCQKHVCRQSPGPTARLIRAGQARPRLVRRHSGHLCKCWDLALCVTIMSDTSEPRWAACERFVQQTSVDRTTQRAL